MPEDEKNLNTLLEMLNASEVREDGKHERHVFDAKNKYGELCPQQEKALEELGFELPDPTKKIGKFNNRKMSFDAECRKLFLEIAQRNEVLVDCGPIYGGLRSRTSS